MIYQSKDYSSRKELELEVGKTNSLTPDKKPDIIEGTRKELERLGLSDRTTFYGLSCVISDIPTIIKTQNESEKPNRGEIKSFGINGVKK